MKDIWAYQTQDESLVALFRKDHLLASMNAAVAAQDPIPGVRFSVIAAGRDAEAFMETGIRRFISLLAAGPQSGRTGSFPSATSQRITTYIWTGILMTAGIVLLSLLLAGYLRRQIRLTRLKNDLIANCVARAENAARLDAPCLWIRCATATTQDAQLVQEYLQMISKENARLSSLIEEFLTFSRMERNKAKFDQFAF